MSVTYIPKDTSWMQGLAQFAAGMKQRAQNEALREAMKGIYGAPDPIRAAMESPYLARYGADEKMLQMAQYVQAQRDAEAKARAETERRQAIAAMTMPAYNDRNGIGKTLLQLQALDPETASRVMEFYKASNPGFELNSTDAGNRTVLTAMDKFSGQFGAPDEIQHGLDPTKVFEQRQMNARTFYQKPLSEVEKKRQEMLLGVLNGTIQLTPEQAAALGIRTGEPTPESKRLEEEAKAEAWKAYEAGTATPEQKALLGFGPKVGDNKPVEPKIGVFQWDDGKWYETAYDPSAPDNRSQWRKLGPPYNAQLETFDHVLGGGSGEAPATPTPTPRPAVSGVAIPGINGASPVYPTPTPAPPVDGGGQVKFSSEDVERLKSAVRVMKANGISVESIKSRLGDAGLSPADISALFSAAGL